VPHIFVPAASFVHSPRYSPRYKYCPTDTAEKRLLSSSNAHRKRAQKAPTMCQQNIISIQCPTCRQEVRYRYEDLIRCPNRYYCFVHRPRFEELAAHECESCAQRRREAEQEARRREEERNSRDRADEDERDAERDRRRKGERSRIEREKEEWAEALIKASREERERKLEKTPSPTRGSWTGNKRRYRDF
jgi:hypothetical protein